MASAKGRFPTYAKYGILPPRRRIAWLRSTASDLGVFPDEAKFKLGTALRVAQEGGMHHSAKPMKGKLREVIEIVALCDDETFRLMYASQLGEAIYVLHTFKKKAHHGSATPKRNIALIQERLQLAKRIAKTEGIKNHE